MCFRKKRIEPKEDNPIDELMAKSLEKLKSVVDSSTIIGNPIENSFGAIILPVSRVSFGLVTGGGEYSSRKKQSAFPFAGGSGAGVNVTPVGFLTIVGGVTNFIKVENRTSFDKFGDLIPELINSLKNNSEDKKGGKSDAKK